MMSKSNSTSKSQISIEVLAQLRRKIRELNLKEEKEPCESILLK